MPLLKYMLTAEDTVIPPALLFCGPSGVGKTTAARIVASAVNCREDNAPCGTCSSCVAVQLGNHPAVVEIDAAISGGAEAIRKLRELSLVDTGLNHQCFIVDEAHSISWQGWNALLKILEEPIGDVTFMLVTSEPFKVPVKVRTRCIRFDFSTVAPEPMRQRLTHVVRAEDVLLSPDEMDLIVDESKGSMREAIKLLEIVTKSGSGEVIKKDFSIAVLDSIIADSAEEGIKILLEWWNKVGSFQDIVHMIGECLEGVLIVKYDLPNSFSEKKSLDLERFSDTFSEHQWASMMETVADWSAKDGSRAHLSMLWTVLRKSIHGAASDKILKSKSFTSSRAAPVNKEDIVNALRSI